MATQESLLDLVLNERDDADEEAPSLLQNSPYYDENGLIEILKSKQNIFSLITLNCQSLNAKYDQIKLFIELLKNSSTNVSAICIQETWLSDASDAALLQLENYNFISRGKSCSAHGGVAIYLHEMFEYKILPFHSTANIWDGIFIEIYERSIQNNNRKKLVIGNIYRPPRNNVENYTTFTEEINEIASLLERNRCEVIIVGDFNLDLLKMHINEHIKYFFESMLSNSYIPKITFPTRLTNNSGTLIDNIYVKLSYGFSETTAGILWNNISDHQPCFVTLDYMFKSTDKSRYVKVYPNKPDLMYSFKQEIANSCILSNFTNDYNTNPNNNYEILNENIKSALQQHLSIRIVKFNKHKHKKSSWISNGIIRSIKYRDRLYADLMKLDPSDESYNIKKTNLKLYNRILKQNIRVAKKMYFHSCFENFKDDIKKTWATINSLLNRARTKSDFPESFLIRGQSVTDPKVISNEFNNFFVNVGTNLTENIITPQNRTFQEYLTSPSTQQFYFHSVERNDVLKIIDQLKPKTSSGVDGLSNKLLKFIKYEICDSLTLIINQSIHSGIFPEQLKLARVLPLFKKGVNSVFDNYRPISLLPSISKVFERVMHHQIQDYFNKYHLFYGSQYGFRPDHSTELAVLEVVDQIMTQMDKNKTPINIYLDLSKAFDSLDHKILLSKLQYYGFYGLSYSLMKSYLENRKQYVSFNDINSDNKLINAGVPQGSILGPLLFLIFINDISHATSCFRPVIYADDTTLGACLSHFGQDNDEIEQNLNLELNCISNWFKLNKLTLNAQKTKAMLFQTPQKKVIKPKIFIEENCIEYVEEFNYLGIVLDKHLTWKNHINVIKQKISRMSGILNKLKHFLPRITLITLYNSLVLPYLNYGVLLWGCKAAQLERLQKKLVRIITCSKYNAHSEPILKKLRFLKATHICALHELKFCFKLEQNSLPIYFLNSVFNKLSSTHRYSTRNVNNYRLPGIKHTFMKNSLRYRIPKTFNDSPASIKDKILTHSFHGFKQYVKQHFLSMYGEQCTIVNCYVCG